MSQPDRARVRGTEDPEPQDALDPGAKLAKQKKGTGKRLSPKERQKLKRQREKEARRRKRELRQQKKNNEA